MTSKMFDSTLAITPLQRERAEQVMCGHSGIAVMDRFARELVETGYLQRIDSGTLSASRYGYIQKSLDDGLQRAKSFWGLRSDQIEFCTKAFQSGGLASWIQRHQLDAIFYLKTFTGSLSEHIPSIENTVVGSGARFIFVERPFDLKLKALGSGGFFPFWAQAKQSIGW